MWVELDQIGESSILGSKINLSFTIGGAGVSSLRGPSIILHID